MQKLPYLYHDPHKLDKKVDPRKLRFGSKIDQNFASREEYFTVKEVISPELLKLNNDLVVRLLGVEGVESTKSDAIQYLRDQLRGQKIYLKYDQEKYYEQNRLLCYVYLKNKTFINAHLIKKGYAHVDDRRHFAYKEKFIQLGSQDG